MATITELLRLMEAWWIPAATLALLLVLLILWEVAVLLGVHIGMARHERADKD